MTTPQTRTALTGNVFRDNRPVEPDEPRVLYRADEHIAHVEINRPLLLNAVNADVHNGTSTASMRPTPTMRSGSSSCPARAARSPPAATAASAPRSGPR
jgi:hypothetical protein